MVSSELSKIVILSCVPMLGLIMFHAVSDEFNTASLFLSILKSTGYIYMLIACVNIN